MGMKEKLLLSAMLMMGGMAHSEGHSNRSSLEVKPFKPDPNQWLGVSVDYLDQYALILNGKSTLGIVKQTRIKEKVEAYAERLIEYYELQRV